MRIVSREESGASTVGADHVHVTPVNVATLTMPWLDASSPTAMHDVRVTH